MEKEWQQGLMLTVYKPVLVKKNSLMLNMVKRLKHRISTIYSSIVIGRQAPWYSRQLEQLNNEPVMGSSL